MEKDATGVQRLERWLEPPRQASRWQDTVRTAVRILWGVARDIGEGSLGRHAASLSYSTLLSLVPILALSFSVLKGLGAENTLMPMLTELLKPLGENAQPINDFIWGFVGKVEAGVLGAFGLAVLAYTAISVIQKIEDAFNELWQIRRPRSLGRKFTDYLSVLLVGPLLAVAAIGVVRSLTERAAGEDLAKYGPLQHALLEALSYTPFALLLLAFAGLYAFLPNTKVRLLPAFGGAIFASLAWLAAGWAFATFVAASASYTAIYSAFAALVLFLIWLNVNWMIVLIGADVAYYLQNRQQLKRALPPALPPAAIERLGLEVVSEIAHRQYAGAPPPTAAELASTLRQRDSTLAPILTALASAGLIAGSEHRPPRYMLVRPPEVTGVAAVLAALRGETRETSAPTGPVDVVTVAVTGAIAAGTASWTVKSLAGAAQPPKDVSRWIDEAMR